MSATNTDGAARHGLFVPVAFPAFDVTWAGAHPTQPGFCLGSEDGRLLCTDEEFGRLGEPITGSMSREAINGVAYSNGWLAVSTRADLTMGDLFDEKKGIVVIPGGAHHVVATPSGCFAAATGTGLVILKAGSGPGDKQALLPSSKEGMYFHRVTALSGGSGQDVLACALGQAGIGISELRWGDRKYNMRIAEFTGVDVVDVCAVASAADSPALAAVGRDGTLVLVRDALRDDRCASIKLSTIQGTAYRLMSRGEDLLLLTSRALYVLKTLAVRLAIEAPQQGFRTQILTIPIEAVDANIVADRWLLIVTADGVLKGDLELIQETPVGPDDEPPAGARKTRDGNCELLHFPRVFTREENKSPKVQKLDWLTVAA